MFEPIFKWAGGKTRLLQDYKQAGFLPQREFTAFVDLFAGACGVTCCIASHYPDVPLIINDINHELIDLYRSMAHDYDTVEIAFIGLVDEFVDSDNRKGFYLACHKRYCFGTPSTSERAALLLFMLKTCFNGLWKSYKKYNGLFSTPPGILQQTRESFDIASIRKFARMLSRASIFCGSYADVRIPDGAFVYADPPYRQSMGYQEGVQTAFDDAAQRALATFLISHSDRCLVAESNRDSDDGFWPTQYATPPFDIVRFPVCYTAGRGTSMIVATEVLIANYALERPTMPSVFGESLDFCEC